MNSKRAQLSFEYLYVIGILLVVLIPLVYYSFDSSSEDIRRERLAESISSLKNGINTVYALGPRNIQKITIDLPGSIANISINNSELNIMAYMGGKISEYDIHTPINVTGSIKNEEGYHTIKIEYLQSGIINITDQ